MSTQKLGKKWCEWGRGVRPCRCMATHLYWTRLDGWAYSQALCDEHAAAMAAIVAEDKKPVALAKGG